MNKIFKKKVQILTNGTRLNHVKGLYDSLHFEYKDENEFDNNWIGVSVHNANDIDRHFEEGYKFLQGEVTKYDGTRNTNNNATWGADYALVDENGIRLHYWIENQFTQAAVQRNPLTERFELHKSDPQQAHDECSFVHHQCHHFINGKLYKCGPVGIMPEFDDQLKFDISEDDRKILHSYEPLSVHEFAQRGKQFIDNIDEVILATNLDVEGEATAMYINNLLASTGIKITIPARGLSVGGDLQYADEATLGRAIQGRQGI